MNYPCADPDCPACQMQTDAAELFRAEKLYRFAAAGPLPDCMKGVFTRREAIAIRSYWNGQAGPFPVAIKEAFGVHDRIRQLMEESRNSLALAEGSTQQHLCDQAARYVAKLLPAPLQFSMLDELIYGFGRRA